MNRELKFRAWCENSGEFIMIYDYLFVNKENNHGMGADFTNDYPCVTKVIDVMQYTGQKDKNGKEIYEGDIINCDYFNSSIVEFDLYHSSFMLNIKNAKYFFGGENIEVIGNIYENQELIQ